VLPNECLHIGRMIDADQVRIKDELSDPRSGLNLDLQYVRVRREQHPELELLGRHLVGDGMRGLDEHFVGDARRARTSIARPTAGKA